MTYFHDPDPQETEDWLDSLASVIAIEGAEKASAAVAAADAQLAVKTAEQSGQSPRFHATPSIRAFAREQQVDLAGVIGTGPSGRILREDVLVALKNPGTAQPTPQPTQQPIPQSKGQGSSPIPSPPSQEDFSKHGPVDEADITELEKFRKDVNGNLLEGEPPLSPLVFVILATAATLKTFPAFNSSLAPGGESLVLKKYYHLGIAVDTPGGLVVPVIKDVDKKGGRDIAGELQRLSANARAGKLAIPDIQGASFTISSLGGIGGTGFAPIVNLPQVAILGLSRSSMQPVWDGQQFVPRLILPFSLSYDHRVIDGAEAARFCRALRQNIEDLKRILL